LKHELGKWHELVLFVQFVLSAFIIATACKKRKHPIRKDRTPECIPRNLSQNLVSALHQPVQLRQAILEWSRKNKLTGGMRPTAARQTNADRRQSFA
jgi:hypothetical protein